MFISGSLFTREFLVDGILEHKEWKNLHENEINDFRTKLNAIFADFPMNGNPLESTTEKDLIEPVIEALGWGSYLTQQTTSKKGRKDVPDYLLFPNPESKQQANNEKQQAKRYRYGLCVLEAKAWEVSLDKKMKGEEFDGRIPSNQILRYLSLADVQSDRNIKYGILTNGRKWRLYFQDAKSRSEDFLEIDLPATLGLKDAKIDQFAFKDSEKQDWLKVFYLLFGRTAFLKTPPENLSFHERALEQGKFWESQVAQNLSKVVFEEVFPQLVCCLKWHDGEAQETPLYFEELRDSALTFFYRLLFVLYAEDRNLLPVTDDKYDDYGLRKRVREDIAKRIDSKDTFSATLDGYYRRVHNLFKAIDKGDSSIGLPPYNGGLFNIQQSPLLNRVEIPDSEFAPILDKLSRLHTEDNPKWINYRDLSVQQLGSIYEGLLEFELALDDDGNLAVRPNIFARKTSGSYYTPESLVKLILEKTVGPLIDEKLALFKNKSDELKKRKSSKKGRLKALRELDPTSAILELKICDPAMGSGHFLVSLVDYLADRILESLVESEEIVDWAEEGNLYASPLFQKISSIREQINQQAKEHRWVVNEDQLDDRHIIRRMILKRCVFGVDKNPMAVELAKVSLWLHTFTVGAPLSFLDHHLKCGDSLFGEFVREAEDYLEERGSMFIASVVAQAKATAKGMAVIEQITDADISEVKDSAEKFKVVEKVTNPLSRFFGFIHAIRWMGIKDKEIKRAVQVILDGQAGDPIQLASGEAKMPQDAESIIKDVFQNAKELDKEERFLHWEIAFPGVWDKWESPEPSGGFDAVIGNPPWDRIKLQRVEWFASRKLEIAQTTRASDRNKLIKKLEENGDSLWLDYLKAGERVQSMAVQARKGGSYPLLSVGDINIYSLFIERAHRLIKRDGIVGLLTPSGIASDKGASAFFKSISTQGRLAGFFDFENKKIFFPDVHASFKFCAYIAGGKDRKFRETLMTFFLHSTDQLKDSDRCFTLGPEDFDRLNPNTGTAPIFRTRRDAEITRRIYEKLPILSNHQTCKVWPVKYFRMFDMTNDSRLFKTQEELEKEGFYPVEGNRLKRGGDEFSPLYVGRMIHHYDHRASSVKVNPENLHNAALSSETNEEQHFDPSFYSKPQFWVDKREVPLNANLNWTLAFRDITNPTNARTLIATVIPKYGAGNTLPLILPENLGDTVPYKRFSIFLLANMSSFIFDYIARQKIQGQHLNWYIIEQLPVVPPAMFEEKIGKIKIADFVRDQVLRLTYTAWDMKPFAEDMGYEDDPFIWDEEDRRHRKAKLDALFFNLYEISEENADYVMETFPIVKRHDEDVFDGRYYTKELILAYMKALKAGDTESRITL